MRVLVVTVVHVPADARIHERQIRALAAHGHDVTLAAPFSATGTPRSLDGVAGSIDLPRAVGRDRVRAVRAAGRVIANVPGDLVLLHDPDLLLAVVGRPRTRPVVWDVHEDTEAALVDRRWVPTAVRPVVAAAVRRAEAWADRNLHLLLAEEGYRRRFAGDHPVVPNLPWLPDDAVEIGRDRVVYLGRVSRGRGAEALAAVAEQLAVEGIAVDVIGPVDPDVADMMERSASSGALRLHGFVPNAQAMRLLDGALAGLSLLRDEPNYRHSLPTKVVEYAAAGLPVVTTPLPAARRLVEESGSGVVVPFEDTEAVAATVRALRDDPSRAARLGAAGRRAARDRYSWDAMEGDFVAQLERWAARR